MADDELDRLTDKRDRSSEKADLQEQITAARMNQPTETAQQLQQIRPVITPVANYSTVGQYVPHVGSYPTHQMEPPEMPPVKYQDEDVEAYEETDDPQYSQAGMKRDISELLDGTPEQAAEDDEWLLGTEGINDMMDADDDDGIDELVNGTPEEFASGQEKLFSENGIDDKGDTDVGVTDQDLTNITGMDSGTADFLFSTEGDFDDSGHEPGDMTYAGEDDFVYGTPQNQTEAEHEAAVSEFIYGTPGMFEDPTEEKPTYIKVPRYQKLPEPTLAQLKTRYTQGAKKRKSRRNIPPEVRGLN